MHVGTIIKAARQQAGLTQTELAERLGMRQTAVANAEGKPSMGVARLARFAKALGLRLVVTLA